LEHVFGSIARLYEIASRRVVRRPRDALQVLGINGLKGRSCAHCHVRFEHATPRDFDGEHLRRITPGVAELLLAEGRAEISAGNGRIRSVKLVETAQTHAARIGEASAPSYGVKFTRRELLDNGSVVWAFHRRSFDKPME